ncbi:MAG: hypothetical protein ABWJ42_05795 [Sulfolobales archaeon]
MSSKNILVLDLRREAESCGGVVAAILTYLRKLRSGDEMKIIADESQVKELEEALDLFVRHGVIRIISKNSPTEYIIARGK